MVGFLSHIKTSYIYVGRNSIDTLNCHLRMKIKSLLVSGVLMAFFLQSCSNKSETQNPVTPSIANIIPARDSVGGTVTINGSNFSALIAENVVKFGSLSARVISATVNKLVVEVPAGLPNDYIVTVTANGQTATWTTNFKIVLSAQLLIEGNWKYAKSVRCDTEYFAPPYITQPWPFTPNTGTFFNMDTTFDYLKFKTNNTLNSFQSSWGTGQAGRLYKDTIQYSISGNLIILSYPAGINTESLSIITGAKTPFSYQAYQDTIFVSKLTSSSMVIKRNYHYKHYGWSQAIYVKKESLDSLVKY